MKDKTIYSVAEFMGEFGYEMDLLTIKGQINYDQILIGSENVLVEKSIIPELKAKIQMENGKQLNFIECFIEVRYFENIPVYTLKRKY